ncbi:hypothetical protein Pla52o_50810 [Novipirellula galeiformis]|uniref:Phage gp6-like head-tail connector protein n=2 Tax=Novipirellula galeiformis TaxID=2528004 RepID=A0A5C6C017_9BACT|nr:hypothetical protein Pla52o_50810 [Novipirellula galeiformis]
MRLMNIERPIIPRQIVPRQIVPGISLNAAGHATIDPSVHDALFDLALRLETPTRLPVDFEHVVAAIVMAAHQNEIDAGRSLSADDTGLIEILTPHIKSVFARYGGNVGSDE